MEPIKRDMELLSNSMATYAHIQANPESFALYFMMGVCFGLLMALCLLVTGIACRPRRLAKAPTSPERRRLKESSEEDDSMADDRTRELVEVDGGCEMLKVTVAPASEHGSSRSNGTLRSVNVFASAEELEKARRLEERERIVREIWRNGQPDILATGTGTIGRVHYH
uniref:Eva-1 homolog Bb (C. elegans) n=1 Tax=Gadus morhua TaxID=8049 RepID=A0A8C4ZR47_GADMO